MSEHYIGDVFVDQGGNKRYVQNIIGEEYVLSPILGRGGKEVCWSSDKIKLRGYVKTGKFTPTKASPVNKEEV